MPGGEDDGADKDVGNEDKEAGGDRDGDQADVLDQLELHQLLLFLLARGSPA